MGEVMIFETLIEMMRIAGTGSVDIIKHGIASNEEISYTSSYEIDHLSCQGCKRMTVLIKTIER
jgi:hypothetical protein